MSPTAWPQKCWFCNSHAVFGHFAQIPLTSRLLTINSQVIVTLYLLFLNTNYFAANVFQAGIYLFNVENRNIRTMYEICSKLTIKAPKRHQWHCSGENKTRSGVPLLTLNKWMSAGLISTPKYQNIKIFHNQFCFNIQLFADGVPSRTATSLLIYRANQWTRFYMSGTSAMKELISFARDQRL